jgi:hypothetical protein
MLLQSHMRVSSSEDAFAAAPTKLLILIVSTHKHADNWDYLKHWSDEVHHKGQAVILTGQSDGVPWPHGEKGFHYDASSRVLVVNASETYEHLAVRMMMAYHSILLEPEFADFTHILKLDDTTILGSYAPSKPVGMNARLVELALSKRPGDYLTPEFGYRAYDCENLYPSDAMQWHFRKHLVNSSYWYKREQPCDGVFTYADGEFGYILSRPALNMLAERWPMDSMDDLYQSYVFEDMMVGKELGALSVTLHPIRLQGMPHWTRHSCVCSPTEVTAECDEFCIHSDRRCCWSTCRSQPGLCQSVLDA